MFMSEFGTMRPQYSHAELHLMYFFSHFLRWIGYDLAKNSPLHRLHTIPLGLGMFFLTGGGSLLKSFENYKPGKGIFFSTAKKLIAKLIFYLQYKKIGLSGGNRKYALFHSKKKSIF